MAIDKKIIEEIKRYNSINKYILEQELPEPPVGDAPPLPGGDAPVGDVPVGDAPPLPGGDAPVGGETPAEGEPQPIDTETDPDVEKIDDEGNPEGEEGMEDTDSEELDITDLVTTQKDMGQKQDEYFDKLFGHLDNLESKLGEMDQLMSKINSMEEKIEKYREKTPQEKLELRSLDSGPFNQKLTDFFIDKEPDMEKSGKNEYILTSDDVENFSSADIKNSFTMEPKKNFGF
jgi:hypothetical protein